MTIELDGRQMTDRAALHSHLKERLALPDYYGRNLDALYDLLTERGEETAIVLRNQQEMEAALGPYAHSLRRVLEDAAERNPALTFRAE